MIKLEGGYNKPEHAIKHFISFSENGELIQSWPNDYKFVILFS